MSIFFIIPNAVYSSSSTFRQIDKNTHKPKINEMKIPVSELAKSASISLQNNHNKIRMFGRLDRSACTWIQYLGQLSVCSDAYHREGHMELCIDFMIALK